MRKIWTPLTSKGRANHGASMLGYGLVVGLIGVVALSAIDKIGEQSELVMCGAADAIGAVTGAGCAPSPLPSPAPLLAFTTPPTITVTSSQSSSDCQIFSLKNLGETAYNAGEITLSLEGPQAGEFAWCRDTSSSPKLYSNAGDTNNSTIVSNTQLHPNNSRIVAIRMLNGHSGSGQTVETRAATIVATATDGMRTTATVTGNAYNDDRAIAAFPGHSGGSPLSQSASQFPVTSGCTNLGPTNIGTATANTISITVSGPDASLVNTCVDGCNGNTLAPGASCTHGINFGPMTELREHNFTLTANFDNGGSIANRQMVWVINPSPLMRAVEPSGSSPGDVQLGTLTANGTGPCMDIEVTNTGLAEALALGLQYNSSNAPSGSSFTQCTPSTDECSFPLAVGDTCRFGLQHVFTGSTPVSGGPYYRSIRLNGYTSTLRFSLNIP